jgi:hypothetical protein
VDDEDITPAAADEPADELADDESAPAEGDGTEPASVLAQPLAAPEIAGGYSLDADNNKLAVLPNSYGKIIVNITYTDVPGPGGQPGGGGISTIVDNLGGTGVAAGLLLLLLALAVGGGVAVRRRRLR